MVSKGTKVTPTRKRRAVKEVVKVEEESLRDYELVLIINPEISEEKFEVALDNISQLISGGGGGVSHVEQWGKRKLAYPIGRFVEGSYVLTRFNMRPTQGKELEAKLGISEEVLRHLLIRLNN